MSLSVQWKKRIAQALTRLAYFLFIPILGVCPTTPIYGSDTQQEESRESFFFLGPSALREKTTQPSVSKQGNPRPKSKKVETQETETLERVVKIEPHKAASPSKRRIAAQAPPQSPVWKRPLSTTNSEAWKTGRKLFSQGQYNQAITQLKRAVQELQGSETQVDSLLLLATAYQQIGQYPKAFDTLKQAKERSAEVRDPRRQIVTQLQISDLYLAMGKLKDSEDL